MATPTSVLFVCLGNICRSPLAEGVVRHEIGCRGLADWLRVDSCGTGGWHVGEPPDARSVRVARRHGIDISGLRARQIATEDFERFDWLVAMDRDNEAALARRLPGGGGVRVARYMMFVPAAPGPDVPDPYYGGPQGFTRVYDLIARGAGPLIDAILAGISGPP